MLNTNKTVTLILALTAYFSFRSSAQTQSNVSYGTDALQKLDYFAASNPNSPVVVVVHGGGWYTGDKNGLPYKNAAQLFNNQGYAVVNINYRLTPSVTYPSHIEDLACALAWTKKNASTFNGDSSRVALYGHSAGGQMSAFLGVNHKSISLSNCSYSSGLNVDAVLLSSATVDFDLTNPSGWNSINNMLGDSAVYWNVAQPVNHSSKNFDTKFLILCGELDDLWIGQDSVFHDSLKQYGHCSELKMFMANDHNSLIENLTVSDTVFKSMVTFLDSLWYGNLCPPAGLIDDKELKKKTDIIVYPNPFNISTDIEYYVSNNTEVLLLIYNVNNQLVKTLVNVEQTQGIHRISWDRKNNNSKNVSNGIYYCKMLIDDTVTYKRIILVD